MPPPKKTRADARLDNLPAEIQDELYRRLTENQEEHIEKAYLWGRPDTLEEARDWLQANHNFKTAVSSLSGWRANRRLREDLAATDDEVRALQDWLRVNATDLSSEDILEVGNLLFANRALKENDIASYKAVADLILRRQTGTRDDRKIAVMEAKLEDARTAKAQLTDSVARAKQAGGLTAETLAQIEAAAALL